MGFTDLEIYHQSQENFRCRVHQGELDEFVIAGEGGLAVRGLYGGRVGYAYAERIDADALDDLLLNARASAEVTDSLDPVAFYAGSPIASTPDLWSSRLAATTPAAKADLLQAIEHEALRLDSRVRGFNWCSLGSVETSRTLANTRGLSRSERTNRLYVALSLVVQQGEETRTANYGQLAPALDAIDPSAVAQQLVSEALSYLGAQPVPTGSYAVVLRHKAAASLLAVMADAFCADRVQKGRSRLRGRVGQRIAGEQITLVDDPLLPDGRDSRSFDCEGVASRPLQVVERGVLQTLLHNLTTAQVDGVPSTGHAYKSSYKGAITVAPSNFYLQPGDHALSDLLGRMQNGLLITDLQGLHAGANPVSGDFSLACHGYLIDGGTIARPVDQIIVGGNFFDLLGQITAIGHDLTFAMTFGGYVGAPSVLVERLMVSGT